MPPKIDPKNGVHHLCGAVALAGPGTDAPSRFQMLAYTGQVIDWCGWRFVISLPGVSARPKFPILREHERDRVVGFADSWATDAEGLHVGGVFSETTPDGAEVLALAKEGFPWQASIGVTAKRVTEVRAGATVTVNGMELSGPLDVWEESEVSEVSFVALGADSDTEAGIATSKPHTEQSMNKHLRAVLVSLGMPADADEQAAEAYLAAHAQAALAKLAETVEAMKSKKCADDAAETPAAETPEENKPEEAGADLSAKVTAALAAERKRVRDIGTLCRRMGLSETFAAGLADEGATLVLARERVLEELAKNNPRVGALSVEEGLSESDRFRSLAAQGVLLGLGLRPKQALAGAEEFRHLRFQGLARLCLERAGVNARRMSNIEVAQAVLSPRARLAASTSDFSGLFLDVANKLLLQSFENVAQTWRPFCNVIPASDFKDIYGVQISGGPDLKEIGENEEYENGYLSDNAEKYRVTKQGRIVTLSLEMLVNDDLNAFAQLPRMFGAMAARRYNDIVYGLIKSNPNMSDGNAVFSAAHKNLPTAAKLTSDSLDAAWQAMTLQTGLGGEMLDIVPHYLVVPPALRTNALVLLTSSAMPVAQMNAGTYNVWQDAGLIPIVEPRLQPTGNAAAPWYLFADPGMHPTVNVSFLDGKETPDIIEHDDFRVDGIAYKVRAIMGAGWVDYRGALKNAGSDA